MSAPAGAPIALVLFDLDGTLADTAPDLANALNAVLAEQGRPALPLASVRSRVSMGTAALIRLGFPDVVSESEQARLRERLIAHYRDDIARHTRLFAGMETLLEAIERRGRRWGVVTNKPARLTGPLMEALALARRACCIVSGDTVDAGKPHPAPLLHAAALAGCTPGACMYVGDAERDVEAGRRAGMRTLIAMFGYVDPADRPHCWGADGMVDTPAQILDWLD